MWPLGVSLLRWSIGQWSHFTQRAYLFVDIFIEQSELVSLTNLNSTWSYDLIAVWVFSSRGFVPSFHRKELAITWTSFGWPSSWWCAPSWRSHGTWLPPSSPLLTSTVWRWRRRPLPLESSPSSLEWGMWRQKTVALQNTTCTHPHVNHKQMEDTEEKGPVMVNLFLHFLF